MRARNIKPGFFKHGMLAECEPSARVFFAVLWTLADREGRLGYRPKKIRAELSPYDERYPDALLGQFAAEEFTFRCQVGEVLCIQIVSV